MSAPCVIVVGSINADLVVSVERLPAAGETVTGGRFSRHGGGKGANQAVAAARLGAQVTMVGAVGDDPFGEEALTLLRDDGVDIESVTWLGATATGVALITVDATGENQIAVASGANARLDGTAVEGMVAAAVAAAGSGSPRPVVLLGHEVPETAVLGGVRAAGDAAIVLNPAPARRLPDELLARRPILTPNASEASELSGEGDPEAAAAALAARSGAPVLVTLGRRGVLLWSDGSGEVLPAPGGRRGRHHGRRRRVQRRAGDRAGARERRRRGGAVRGRGRGAVHARRGRARGDASARRGRGRARVKRLAAAGAVAALAAYAGLYEPRRLVVRRADLALPHWPQALAGLRVGVMSDLHAGSPHASADMIGTWVERMNAEAPDLVALPGDFLDAHFLFGGRLAPERIGERLAALRAPLGAVAVLGNHDWKLAGARMWLALERAGIVVLENASHAIEARGTRFHVAGLGDFRLRHPDVVEGAGRACPTASPCCCSRTTRTCSPACPPGSRSRSPGTPTAARSRCPTSAARSSRRATASGSRAA